MKVIPAALVALALGAGPAMAASEPPSLTRVMTCKGPDATMEIYLADMEPDTRAPQPPYRAGAYALDLSAALKGKHLEQVHITITPDRKFLIVDQYTRGLPPTKIPMAGGTVNFDDRFGTDAKCAPFLTQQ